MCDLEVVAAWMLAAIAVDDLEAAVDLFLTS